MAITTTTNRNDYIASAAQTGFPYTFKITTSADLRVYVNDVLKTVAVDYTVDGVGVATGGNVTFAVGRTAGERVALVRTVALDQQIVYPANDKFPSAVHEAGLDKLTMIAQQLHEADGRALAFAPSATQSGKTVDSLVASKVLRVKADASGIEMADATTAGVTLPLPTVNGGTGASLVPAAGDLLQGTASNVFERLAVGARGALLYVTSALKAGWLPAGADGQHLVATSGASTGVAWVDTGVFSADAYGAVGDYRRVGDAAMTATSAQLTSATAGFTAGDVGKKILVDGAGVAGAPLVTTVSGYTNATTVQLAAAASTTVAGKTAEMGTDDTTAIQAAITAAKAVGGTVRFAAKAYFHGALNLTDGTLALEGAGFAYGATRLYTFATSGTVWDCTGARTRWRNLQIGWYGQLGVPSIGLLLAASVTNPGIDFCSFENVFVAGRYSLATLYVYGVASSAMYKTAFWNHYDSSAYTVMFTAANISAVTSAFVAIAAGTKSVSDWTFVATEIHEQHKAAGASTAAALYLGGVLDWRYYGGNISGSGPNLVSIASDSGASTPSRIIFSGTSLYSENGTAPTYIFSLISTVAGLDLRQCYYQYATAVFTGAGGITGGGSGFQIAGHNTPGLGIVANSTVYVGVTGQEAAAVNAEIMVTKRMLVCGLRVILTASPGVGQSCTVTVVKNGALTAITTTINGLDTIGTDLMRYAEFAAGDRIVFKVDTSLAATTLALTAGVECIPL